MENDKSIIIHETAIIDEGASIGSGCRIWHWAHVCSKSIIGNECSLGQNVFVANNTVIGNNVKIQNNVSIYEKVVLEDNVFCGPSMVFTNVYNPRSQITRKNEYKQTLVKNGATLGANCTIICGIKIGSNAFIGAGSVVTKDVKDFALMVGVPARQIGWMSAFGERINLPLQGNGEWSCKSTGDKYVLRNDQIIHLPSRN